MPTAFITGGTKRIGRYIAKAFAQKGYDLILHDHSDTSYRDEIEKEYKDFPNNVYFVNANLLDKDAVKILCDDVSSIYTVPDVIIHTASLFEKDNFNDFTRDAWDKHINIHALAPLEITQYFSNKSAHIKNTHKVSVVFLVDQRINNPNPDFFSYTASKMLIANLIQTSAMALCSHMRINGVSPGPTLKNTRQSQDDFDLQSRLTPLEHAVSPDDIASACLFLSETASITGQILTLDSGQSLDWRTEAYMRVKE